MRNVVVWLLVVGVLQAACGGAEVATSGGPTIAGACVENQPDCRDTRVGTEEPAGGAPIDVASGVTREEIDGVWVFLHDPEAIMQARHGGKPTIVDGCLYVDDSVVVWHVDQLEEAEAAIAAVRAGEQPDLLIGGGGLSLDEGATPGQIPNIITDACPTRVVWFGNP
jgi:hypothetical protein